METWLFSLHNNWHYNYLTCCWNMGFCSSGHELVFLLSSTTATDSRMNCTASTVVQGIGGATHKLCQSWCGNRFFMSDQIIFTGSLVNCVSLVLSVYCALYDLVYHFENVLCKVNTYPIQVGSPALYLLILGSSFWQKLRSNVYTLTMSVLQSNHCDWI